MLRFLQSQPWEAAERLRVRPHIVHDTRSILYRYLLTILERQVKSTAFLRRLQQQTQTD